MRGFVLRQERFRLGARKRLPQWSSLGALIAVVLPVLWCAACLAAEPTLEDRAAALVRAYPNQLKGFESGFLVWRDGTRMRFANGAATKSTTDLVNKPDIKDMFKWPYDFGGSNLSGRVDAGRIRNEAFFEKMYGPCTRFDDACVRLQCHPNGAVHPVPWVPGLGGGTLNVTSVNGVDAALSAVSKDIERALDPKWKDYLVPAGGGYAPRCIAGTARLSVHAFGIAVDLNPKYGQYWLYGLPAGTTEQSFEASNKPLRYDNKMPLQIVAIFEKHGFIWGGRWYHFDGMHFEYRPEFKALKEIMDGKASGGRTRDGSEAAPK